MTVFIYGFLPFDPVFEVLFFAIVLLMLVPIVALMVVSVIRSRRFGYVFPPEVIGLKLNPSQTAATVSLVPTKDTVETKDQNEIYHAHQRSIYTHTKSGVRFAIIEPISDFAQNARLVHYIMKLKDGEAEVIGTSDGSDPSKKSKGLPKMNSLQEARLWWYEHDYLTSAAAIALGQKFINEEKAKIEQAKGFLDVTKPMVIKEVGSSASPDGTVTQLNTTTATEENQGPMGPADFDLLMLGIQERIISSSNDIYPLTIDGETISFNALERWMASPSPENTLDEQFQRGYRKGQREFSRQSTDFIKIAFAFLLIALGAAFLFAKV